MRNSDTAAGTSAWPGDPRGGTEPSRDVRVGFLDLPGALPHEDEDGVGPVAWVSLVHPSRVAGALVDEAAFEGAWLEDAQAACFRVRGVTTRMAAPVLGSQAEARQWLADTWAALRLGGIAEASDAAAGRNAMAA